MFDRRPYRQGDVILIPSEGPLPKGACLIPGRAVLALGEATGHAHAVAEPDVELYATAASADRWLRVGSGGATVVHEEHPAVTLPAGLYLVRIRREYAPQEIRRVAD